MGKISLNVPSMGGNYERTRRMFLTTIFNVPDGNMEDSIREDFCETEEFISLNGYDEVVEYFNTYKNEENEEITILIDGLDNCHKDIILGIYQVFIRIRSHQPLNIFVCRQEYPENGELLNEPDWYIILNSDLVLSTIDDTDFEMYNYTYKVLKSRLHNMLYNGVYDEETVFENIKEMMRVYRNV